MLNSIFNIFTTSDIKYSIYDNYNNLETEKTKSKNNNEIKDEVKLDLLTFTDIKKLINGEDL